MINLLICGMNIACHLRNVNYTIQKPKYPPDVAQICQYFEEQKKELPDYCKWEDNKVQPRRRSDF